VITYICTYVHNVSNVFFMREGENSDKRRKRGLRAEDQTAFLSNFCGFLKSYNTFINFYHTPLKREGTSVSELRVSSHSPHEFLFSVFITLIIGPWLTFPC
jgi:hypothetical protein